MNAAVLIAPHNPSFIALAKQEARRWQSTCGAALTGFHHIGSTAVPGLIAKPILDIMPVFASLEQLDALRDRICALGVTWWGEYGLPGRRYCKRAEADCVQHIHCYAEGKNDIIRHLAFRDYLRVHHDVAGDYARVKRACADRHADDRNAYGDCKSDWIKAAEKDALIWYKQR